MTQPEAKLEPTQDHMVEAYRLYEATEDCISEVDTIEAFARFLASRDSSLIARAREDAVGRTEDIFNLAARLHSMRCHRQYDECGCGLADELRSLHEPTPRRQPEVGGT